MNDLAEQISASTEGNEMFLIHMQPAQRKFNSLLKSCGLNPGLSVYENINSLLPTSRTPWMKFYYDLSLIDLLFISWNSYGLDDGKFRVMVTPMHLMMVQ